MLRNSQGCAGFFARSAADCVVDHAVYLAVAANRKPAETIFSARFLVIEFVAVLAALGDKWLAYQPAPPVVVGAPEVELIVCKNIES